jgi:hypothetical protein
MGALTSVGGADHGCQTLDRGLELGLGQVAEGQPQGVAAAVADVERGAATYATPAVECGRGVRWA